MKEIKDLKKITVLIGKDTLVLDSEGMMIYFDNQLPTIANWKKKGLEMYAVEDKRQYFDIVTSANWKVRNIKDRFSPKKKKTTDLQVTIPPITDEIVSNDIQDMMTKIDDANKLLHVKTTTFEGAERIKKVLDALLVAVSIGIKTNELIPKKDTEKVILEMVAMLIAGYQRDIKILPNECANRSEVEIREILSSSYKANISNYQKISKSDVSKSKSVIDIIERATELLGNGESVEDILERM